MATTKMPGSGAPETWSVTVPEKPPVVRVTEALFTEGEVTLVAVASAV